MKIEVWQENSDSETVRLWIEKTVLGASIRGTRGVRGDGTVSACVAEITPLGILRNPSASQLLSLPGEPDGRIAFHPEDPASKLKRRLPERMVACAEKVMLMHEMDTPPYQLAAFVLGIKEAKP